LVVVLLLGANGADAQILLLSQWKGAVVADTGTVSRLSCPIGGKYDCGTWPLNLVEFKGETRICFDTASGYFSYEDALIVVDTRNKLYLFVKDGLLSEGFKVYPISETYKCPEVF
jgi:hypothetical protein